MWWWEGRLVLDGGDGGRLVRESGRARGRETWVCCLDVCMQCIQCRLMDGWMDGW